MKPYDHKKIEKKWQKAWASKKIYKASDTSEAEKFYPLVEFPFPSGAGLHTGHIRSYTAMDIIARKRRANGFNVLFPIGWDAFGLPTENYAIKTGVQPAVATKKNTDNFRKQLVSLGLSFDWSREVNTTDPKYYKWTQWIFLQMYKNNLAYKAKMTVNWCPKDKIVLANEEVIDGHCERCGTAVEKREKDQWILAITKYADRLDRDLDTVDYLERIKIQQRNWIGRSEGAEIDFNLVFKKNPADNDRRGPNGEKAHISVFTTRPDTLFGVTYIVLSPEHLWVKLATDAKHDVLNNKEEVKAYMKKVAAKTEIERTDAGKEKTGVKLEGVVAINPATGEEIPIYIADYVLADYGTGAVMAVPAHDTRDMEFAQKYDLPIKIVIEPVTGKEAANEKNRKSIVAVVKNPKTGKYISINWGNLGGNLFIGGGIDEGEDVIEAAKREIAEETGYTDVKFISKGEKIHHHYIAHSKNNEPRNIEATGLYFELASEEKRAEELEKDEVGKFTVEWLAESEILSKVKDELHALVFKRLAKGQAYTGYGLLVGSEKFTGMKSEEVKKDITELVGGKWITKYKLRDWIFSRQRYWGEPIPMIHCESCGWVPVPEKDLPVTLPKVKQYVPTDTGESPLSAVEKWVKVKCPQCKGPGRRETDTMPNWAGSSWYYLRYVDPKNGKAFADMKKLEKWTPVDWYNGGMEHTTLHLLYSRFWHKFLYDIKAVPTIEPYMKRTSHGMILAADGEKMSKSKGNVVNPDDLIELYGADTLRLHEMFMGPFDQAVSWNTEGMIGLRRFIERTWRNAEKAHGKTDSEEIITLLNQTIKKVEEDVEKMAFNTAISTMMVFTNALEREVAFTKNTYETFLKILAPFAPHVADELWSTLGNKKSIHMEAWPKFDPKKTVASTVTMPIQINGRIRATLVMAVEATEDEVKGEALKLPEIQKWMEGESVVRIVFVPGKIINFITKKA